MLDTIHILQLMNSLSKRRPLFHSEADLQFELSKELWMFDKNLEIYLERPIKYNSQDYHIDIFLVKENYKIAIELKYKTSKLHYKDFNLKHQQAHNCNTYHFAKDIKRLENLKQINEINCGYAIFLTNSSNYWENSNNNTNYTKLADFSSLQTIKSTCKENSFSLTKDYKLNWNFYSRIPSCNKNCVFKFLLIKV